MQDKKFTLRVSVSAQFYFDLPMDTDTPTKEALRKAAREHLEEYLSWGGLDVQGMTTDGRMYLDDDLPTISVEDVYESEPESEPESEGSRFMKDI